MRPSGRSASISAVHHDILGFYIIRRIITIESVMLNYLVLILGLFLLAVAVTMVLRALTSPRGPSTETIEQIGHYGFAGSLPARGRRAHRGRPERLDDFAASAGRWFGSRFGRLKGEDYRARLITAGMYTWTPDRLLGDKFLGAVGGTIVALWLAALAAAAAYCSSSRASVARVLGWVLPIVHRRLARPEAPRAGRARAAGSHRPPRRDARGGAQLRRSRSVLRRRRSRSRSPRRSG